MAIPIKNVYSINNRLYFYTNINMIQNKHSKEMRKNMKQILLLCAMGMSTSLLVRKLEKQAAEEGYDCEIDACSAFDVEEFPKTPDLIVLGPQVKHRLEEFRDQYPSKKVIALDTILYGMMDAENILKVIRKELE